MFEPRMFKSFKTFEPRMFKSFKTFELFESLKAPGVHLVVVLVRLV